MLLTTFVYDAKKRLDTAKLKEKMNWKKGVGRMYKTAADKPEAMSKGIDES